MEIAEKTARRIFNVGGFETTWQSLSDEERLPYRRLAKSIIKSVKLSVAQKKIWGGMKHDANQ